MTRGTWCMMINKICKRCGRPVIRSKDSYDVFEGMHWLCFHLEFEHDGDPDDPCKDISCPWFQIQTMKKELVALGIDPDDLIYKKYMEKE